MALDSTGRAHWEGDLTSGSGTATLDSGVAGPMQVTWKARSEEHASGLTSPEELIAAAHAACYSMAFSARLGKAGGTSIVLDTEATATFVPGEGITGIALSVKGSAEGVSEEDFASLAEDARENCPVSQALKGNVPITLEASMT
jgi:lipoyl-dependent peroxiredoxin